MPLGLMFWILMLIWFVFGLAWNFGFVPGTVGPAGNSLFLFLLFLLVGWKIFGAPLHQ